MAKRIYSYLLIGTLFLSITGCHKNQTSFLENFREPNQNFEIDLNNDGINETGKIEEGIAYIYKNNELIFESDPAWNVKEILAGDFNNDGQNDFALSLWKYGNYGTSLPFWEEENDNSYKMHLFLYTWRREKVSPLWHSSNLPKQNLRTRLLDTNNNGINELIVIEKDYESTQKSIALWTWTGWGFELQKRIKIPH